MSFANFRRRFRTGATKTTTDFLRDTDDSPKSTGRSASEGRGKGLGWRSGRGSAEARRPGGAEPGTLSGSTAWPRVDLPFALPGAAARLPECANRHRKKVVGKGDDGLAVVQHHAGSETGACGRLQLPYPAEIGCGHR